jgi:predicted RNase H-like nuclease (RuvC/YqgF family)
MIRVRTLRKPPAYGLLTSRLRLSRLSLVYVLQLNPICTKLERLQDSFQSREEMMTQLEMTASDAQTSLAKLRAAEGKVQQLQSENESLVTKVGFMSLFGCIFDGGDLQPQIRRISGVGCSVTGGKRKNFFKQAGEKSRKKKRKIRKVTQTLQTIPVNQARHLGVCEGLEDYETQVEGCSGEVKKLQQILKDGAAEYKDAVLKGREVDGLLEDNARLRRKAEVNLPQLPAKALSHALPHLGIVLAEQNLGAALLSYEIFELLGYREAF